MLDNKSVHARVCVYLYIIMRVMGGYRRPIMWLCMSVHDGMYMLLESECVCAVMCVSLCIYSVNVYIDIFVSASLQHT